MPVVAALAGMTIVTGNLMAIPQQNIKRLLAYSGIAHIGYMLLGLAALSGNGVAMVLFYLVAYLFGNMGAFLVVEAVARSEQSDGIDAYRGLAQRSPLLALAMLIFLLSLGGIPFVAGFWAKLYVFWAAIERGMYGLVFLGAVLTVVALYYYLLVARRMYIEKPLRGEPVPVPGLLGTAIVVCVLGVVGIGIYPAPWVEVTLRVASTLFPELRPPAIPPPEGGSQSNPCVASGFSRKSYKLPLRLVFIGAEHVLRNRHFVVRQAVFIESWGEWISLASGGPSMAPL